MVLIVLAAVFAAGGALGVLAVLVLGIHAEERQMSLKVKRQAVTRLESGARRVLGVTVRDGAVSNDRPDRDDVGR
jgi:hypothetical protein